MAGPEGVLIRGSTVFMRVNSNWVCMVKGQCKGVIVAVSDTT